MNEKDQEPAMVEWKNIESIPDLLKWVHAYAPNDNALLHFLDHNQTKMDEAHNVGAYVVSLVMDSGNWDLANGKRLGLDYPPHVKLMRLEYKREPRPGDSVSYAHWLFAMREDCSEIASVVLLSDEESLEIQKATNSFAK